MKIFTEKEQELIRDLASKNGVIDTTSIESMIMKLMEDSMSFNEALRYTKAYVWEFVTSDNTYNTTSVDALQELVCSIKRK